MHVSSAASHALFCSDPELSHVAKPRKQCCDQSCDPPVAPSIRRGKRSSRSIEYKVRQSRWSCSKQYGRRRHGTAQLERNKRRVTTAAYDKEEVAEGECSNCMSMPAMDHLLPSMNKPSEVPTSQAETKTGVTKGLIFLPHCAGWCSHAPGPVRSLSQLRF